MLDLILLLFLVIGFIIGLKRGFILQLVHLVGFAVALIVAYVYFDELAPRLKLWVPYPTISDNAAMSLFLDSIHVESAYYRAIAFAMLFFGTKILLQIVASMLDFLADLPVLRTINGWMGGALGLLEAYFLLFFALYIAAFLQIEKIQSALSHSVIAGVMVEHTPVISSAIKNLWVQTIVMLLH